MLRSGVRAAAEHRHLAESGRSTHDDSTSGLAFEDSPARERSRHPRPGEARRNPVSLIVRARRTSRLLVVTVTSLAALAASSLAFADGVDVSHWQGSISWSKVEAAGMQFAFMKATESTTYTDTRFATNWAGAKSVGLYRGAYHFARPSSGSAAAQARYFVSRVGSFKGAGTLPPVLDLEASGGLSVSALRTWTTNWLRTVEDLTGRTPIIYVSPAFWEHYLGNSTAYTHYPLWIAHYGVSSPRVPGGWRVLDVLAAHQQRIGQRHLRQRRHEQVQRDQRPARRARTHHRWLDRPAAAGPDRAGRCAHRADHDALDDGGAGDQRPGDVHRRADHDRHRSGSVTAAERRGRPLREARVLRHLDQGRHRDDRHRGSLPGHHPGHDGHRLPGGVRRHPDVRRRPLGHRPRHRARPGTAARRPAQEQSGLPDAARAPR